MSKLTSLSSDNQTISLFSVSTVTKAETAITKKLSLPEKTKTNPNLEGATSAPVPVADSKPKATSTQATITEPVSRREWKRGCYERPGKLAAVDEAYLTSKLGQPLDTVRQDLFAYLVRNRESFLEGLRLRLQLRLQNGMQYAASDAENLEQSSYSNPIAALVYELPFDYTPLPTASLRELVTGSGQCSDNFLLPVLIPVSPTSAGKTGQMLTSKPQLRVAVRSLAGTTILDVLSEVLSKTYVLLPAQNLAVFLAQADAEQESSDSTTQLTSDDLVQDKSQFEVEAAIIPPPLSPKSYRPQVVEQLQNKNLSLQKTAQLLNISYRSVCRLRKRGEPKYKSVSDCQIFYAVLERKLSYQEMVEQYGVSRRTIGKSFTRVMNKLVESLVMQTQF